MSAFANLVNRLNPGRSTPQTEQPAPPAFDDREVEVAVLESVGGGVQVTQIVAGALGTMDAQGRFVVDPAYMPISPLMMYVFGQPIPVDGESTRVTRHVVKAGDVAAIRANLMRASAANWSKLYESLGSFAGINRVVLENDKTMSLEKVQEHVASLRLVDHDVPVIAHLLVHVDESGEIDANNLEGHFSGLQIDPTQPAVIARGEPMPGAAENVTQPGSSERVTGLAMGLHDVVIAGAMSIVAQDVEQVERIKGVIVETMLRNNSMLHRGLTLRNPQIQNVNCIENDADDDSDGSGDYLQER